MTLEPLSSQEETALSLPARARALEVTTDAGALEVGEFLVACKQAEKDLDDAYDQPISHAYKLHKSLVAKKKSYLTPIAEAEMIAKALLVQYDMRKDLERRERERELRRQALQAAQKEAEDRAAALEAQGKADEAAAVRAEPVSTPAVIVPAGGVVIPGVSTRYEWDYRLLDPSKLNRAYLEPADTLIRATVRQLKEDAEGVIGLGSIEVFKKGVVSARAGD